MRFSYIETMTDPRSYVALAQAAEQAGFDSFLVADSIGYPAESSTGYPYSPDGTRDFLEDKPFIDPFVLIATMAAVTTKLRFVTNVLKLPVRSPVLVAKQASSVAVMSDNRVSLGVGSSPWPEDYAACGVPWVGRGRRMDESIDIVRGLCAGGWFEHHGDIYDVPRMKIAPTSNTPIPILIGGHGDAALRRAARLGDGWMCATFDDEQLDRLLARLHELRREGGRDDRFDVHAPSLDGYSVDGIRRLEERGVTDVIIGFRDPYTLEPDTQPLSEKIELVRRYGDEVIASARR
jgi:probable F420-dependent oxidoreductase